MNRSAIAFISGLLFAIGLGVSGMTRPEKVIGFLDFTGNWDPTLMFVMFAAIAFHLPANLWAKRQGMFMPAVPCGGQPDHSVGGVATRVDGKLLGGAALFGIGWGMSGYCPGPVLVSVTTGMLPTFLFVVAMLAGIVLRGWLSSRTIRTLPTASVPAVSE